MLSRVLRSVLAASLLVAASEASYAALGARWLSKKPVPIAHWTVSGTDTPVYFVPRHDLPMVDVALVFQAGSARDGARWGLANLTGALIGTGTHRHEEQYILERFGRVGASFDTSVTRDATLIHLRTMTAHRYYSKAVAAFTDVVTKARCDLGVTQRLKKQIVMGLKAEKDDTNAVATKALFKTLYGHHPYAHPIEGTASTVLALVAEDAQIFYAEHMVQKQASVVIVGDLSMLSAHKLAQRLIQPLPVGESLTPLPLSIAPALAKKIYVPMSKSQDAILIAQLGFLPYDPYYYARVVGNEAFGVAPLTSMLFKEVRAKRGLAYGAGSSFVTREAGGPFVMTTQSRVAVAKKASRVMRHTFARFARKGLSETEIQTTKRSLAGQFPLMYASNASIMSRLVSMVVYHFPMTFFADYPEQVAAVTTNEVRQAFAPLKHQNWVEVVAGGRDIFSKPKVG